MTSVTEENAKARLEELRAGYSKLEKKLKTTPNGVKLLAERERKRKADSEGHDGEDIELTELQGKIHYFIDNQYSRSAHIDEILEYVGKICDSLRRPDGTMYSRHNMKKAVMSNLQNKMHAKNVFVKDPLYEDCWMVSPTAPNFVVRPRDPAAVAKADREANEKARLKRLKEQGSDAPPPAVDADVAESARIVDPEPYPPRRRTRNATPGDGGGRSGGGSSGASASGGEGGDGGESQEDGSDDGAGGDGGSARGGRGGRKTRRGESPAPATASQYPDIPRQYQSLVTSGKFPTSLPAHVAKLVALGRGEAQRDASFPKQGYTCRCGVSKSSTKWTKAPWGEFVCTSCRDNIAKKNYCPLCTVAFREKNRSRGSAAEDNQWIGCDDCPQWIHAQCDGIDDLTPYGDDNPNGALPYSCPDCRAAKERKPVKKRRT